MEQQLEEQPALRRSKRDGSSLFSSIAKNRSKKESSSDFFFPGVYDALLEEDIELEIVQEGVKKRKQKDGTLGMRAIRCVIDQRPAMIDGV